MSKWQQYERVFSHFDENGDGRISPSELQQCVRKMGGELSAMDAETTIKFLDLDEDGSVKLEDFVKFVEGGEEEEREKDLKEAFKMYEMEESCCITPKSLKRMLSRLGESKTIDECRIMISHFDLNGDGEQRRPVDIGPLSDPTMKPNQPRTPRAAPYLSPFHVYCSLLSAIEAVPSSNLSATGNIKASSIRFQSQRSMMKIHSWAIFLNFRNSLRILAYILRSSSIYSNLFSVSNDACCGLMTAFSLNFIFQPFVARFLIDSGSILKS
ncbi:EF HAND CALCIUM-BINDING FAMILY PROTEIN [Salix purpurea]|uniref:EF HAND CALCIUM-BINDING FAMILY PROTEIN n=1 Tax=Salix purpurea TaxID=77065 RepID=A0A9Q0VSZ7_SALPP|nr:EF HAND CALCIUM-BINDING FAMILY PROTEIN [Salix purpurea]